MPQQIDIFIHTADHPDGKSFAINDDTTVEELIRAIFPDGNEDVILVLEGEDEPRERHHRLHDCGIKHGHHVHLRNRVIHYLVDGEKQETKHHRLTPFKIMELAKVDPKTHYLIRLRSEGQQPVSYKDSPDVPIHMHQHLKFITGSLGPTPVS
jgi:hypothetical protein